MFRGAMFKESLIVQFDFAYSNVYNNDDDDDDAK